MPLLYKQLMQNYEAINQGKTLPGSTARPFSDYVAWLARQNQEQARHYWLTTLAGELSPSRLPFAKAQARTLGKQETLSWQAPPALNQQLLHFSHQQGLTANTIAQGIRLLLSHYTNSHDVLIGVTVSGRNADLPGMDEQVGLFINSLPLHLKLKPKQTLLAFLQDVQHRAMELRQYEFSALSDIQTWTGMTPLFEQLFVFENYPLDALTQYQGPQDSKNSLQVCEVNAHEQPNYPLNVSADLANNQLNLTLHYNSAIYQQEDLQRLLTHYEQLLQAALPNPRPKPVPYPGSPPRSNNKSSWSGTTPPLTTPKTKPCTPSSKPR